MKTLPWLPVPLPAVLIAVPPVGSFMNPLEATFEFAMRVTLPLPAEASITAPLDAVLFVARSILPPVRRTLTGFYCVPHDSLACKRRRQATVER